MPDGVFISVKRDRLVRKFRQLVPEAEKEVTLAALEGAIEVAGLAQRFVHSQAVRNTIHAEPLPKRLAAMVVAGDASTLVEFRKGSGELINIARLEHYGTKPHTVGGKFAGAHHPGTRANPFLHAAAQLTRKQNIARISRAIGKAARKVSAGGT
jgi:hypothetical protein